MFEAVHPSYAALVDDWQTMDDVCAGERTVKDAGDRYLPPTAGMRANGYGQNAVSGNPSEGHAAYADYKQRSVFHHFTRKAMSGLLGIMHRKAPTVVVPDALLPMVERFSSQGESLDVFWRRVSEAQLRHSRCGLLVDLPAEEVRGEDAVPYVAMYAATTITNWDDGSTKPGRNKLELVVLDESSMVRTESLDWQYQAKYRVLALNGASGLTASTLPGTEPLPDGVYVYAVVNDKSEAPVFVAPNSQGDPLTDIPFVFVNANDVAAEPDKPVLLGLANQDLAIYRGEADYRQALYLQGQDTLLCVGRTPEQMKLPFGAGAVLDVPIGGDARFIGVNPVGIGEQRQAIEADKAEAALEAIQLLDTKGGAAESGDALKVRVSARTASLATLQHTAAKAIKDCLVFAAKWMGLSEAEIEKIEVIPNLEFSESTVDAGSVSLLMDAYAKGLPLSLRSIHEWLVRNGFTKLSFEDEVEASAEEPARSAEGVDPEADPKAEEDAPEAAPTEEDESVNPDAALNGAQIASVVDVVKSVVSGELPRDAAIEILFSSLPIDRATAVRMLGSAGAGFKGPEPEPAPAPAARAPVE